MIDEPQAVFEMADDLVPMTNFARVRDFMQTFRQEVKDFPEFPSEKIQELRIELIREELEELKEAITAKDIVAVADALTDILYVTYGAGVAFGLDLDACFNEVHASNMSKLDENGQPIFREDGKVLKGANYFKPDLFSVLFQGEGSPDPEDMEVVSLEPDNEGKYDVVMRDFAGVLHSFKGVYDEATESLMLS